MNRRKFLTAALSIVAAPAVVRADILMPIKVIPFEPYMVLRGPSLYTGEMMDIRVYDDGSLIDSFVNPSFLDRYNEAARKFAGYPTVGIAHTAEEAKAMRMIEPAQPTAWQPIKKRSVAFDGLHWDGSPIGFEVSPKRG
jgi:hypothetical protein